MDEFSRYAIRVSVAQICQTIGWQKIQSTPLEVLTDFMQEYILGLGRLVNNYATLMGQTEPNLSHVSLAFRDMDISFCDLKDYITYFDSGCALEVPKYPLPKESHLNHLKPGSREVLTRPVHVHDHLPAMFPHLENGDVPVNLSPMHDDISERLSPVPFTKIKSEAIFEDEWNENPQEEDIRPLRELSSVLMTTSGFLSAAREGKLPEVRSTSPEPGQVLEGSKKTHDIHKKKDKENRMKKRHFDEKRRHEKKLKHKRHKKSHDSEKSSDKIKKSLSNSPHQSQLDDKHLSLCSLAEPATVEHSISVATKEESLSSESNGQIDLLSIDIKSEDDCSFEVKDSPNLDLKDDNPSIIDLFSVPQSQCSKTSNDLIDVENFSPPKNFNYSHHLSPFIESGCSNIVTHSNGGQTIGFELDKKSLQVNLPQRSPQANINDLSTNLEIKKHNTFSQKNQCKSVQVKHRKRSPEVLQGNTSPRVKQENDSLEVRRVTSPDPKTENEWAEPSFPDNFVGGSPTFNFNGSSPIIKSDGPILEPSQAPSHSGRLVPGQHVTNEHPLLDLTSHSKKKKKKEKKHKTKDKEKNKCLMLDTPDRGYIHEEKKKKKDKKRDKSSFNIPVPEKTDVLGLEAMPLKKKKLEKNWNGQNETVNKNSIPHPMQTKLEKDLTPILPSRHMDIVNLNITRPSSNSSVSKKSKSDERKKEKKEKRKDKEAMKHLSEDLFTFEPLKRVKTEVPSQSVSVIPKIKFKLGPSPPSEPKQQKIIIKPIVKKDECQDSPRVPGGYQMPTDTTLNGRPHQPMSGHSSLCVTNNAVAVDPQLESNLNQIWICPACNRPDDGSPMIACDLCDLWFHWICVGIREAIEGDWYCKICLAKKEHDKVREKKKKHKKKKS